MLQQQGLIEAPEKVWASLGRKHKLQELNNTPLWGTATAPLCQGSTSLQGTGTSRTVQASDAEPPLAPF